ncbi:BgtE-5642-2 [Blumeria graminis f. sp. tritici]|uniref:BgtE-5642-2 n=3 Tax=Blumeria graminis f. sp. tritici TaxID=62690 RepID=A0A9X9MHI1_BLUGR|nr:putative secreted effector protein [Blumeria graminis f. sp. tritici 96224]VDB88088.1 BgtE-5642-2 [Blumeria graminis f. sp. tritici]
MSYLLAILLYTGHKLPQKDRFVITTSEYNHPSYYNFQVNHEQPFPVPDWNSGIYSTLVNIEEPGTYITVYCSNTASTNDLRGFVSKGLTNLQGRIDRGFSNKEGAEDECF